jgi:hypothetical protein
MPCSVFWQKSNVFAKMLWVDFRFKLMSAECKPLYKGLHSALINLFNPKDFIGLK